MSFRKWFSIIRQSIKGDHHDYTKGNISEAVILLAVPMILELSLESVFAIVDMFFVSQLGQNAIATVGLTESVITIIYSIAIGISTGATAIVARRIGEKNPEAAAHAGAQAMLLAVGLSIILGICGAYFASDVLGLMGASSEVIAEGTPFAKIMLGGNTAILLLFLINGIFRGAGDAAMAMRSLWLASGINIILCPICIHFFGLQGAAIATVIGRSTGVVYQCYHLFKGNSILKIKLSHFPVDIQLVKTILNISWPAAFQFIIGSGSWILLTRLVATTGGTAASAGCQIAFRNFVFFILPAWGLSNAAATLVGQNLGAKQYERAEKCVYMTAKYNAILMAGVSLFFLLCSGIIISVFTDDPLVAAHGTRALRIIGAGYIVYAIGMVFTQAFNGAGDSKTPTWINFFCFWVFQTPLAYFLAYNSSLQAEGVLAAIPLAHILLALIAWHFFKKGRWKEAVV